MPAPDPRARRELPLELVETLEQLFARFLRDGDEHALAELVRRGSERLRSFAARFGLPRDRVDDLVHETLIAAVQQARAFDPEQSLLPWLKGILVRKIASAVRDDARRQRHREAWALRRVPPPDEGPAESAARREILELLAEAIAEVPSRYRAALELHLLQGLTVSETAQRLGRLQVTVRVHLFRGLRELRRRLPPSLLPLLIAMLWPSRVAHSA
ncbi:MAG: sigma-70 family RNA polymerase sigma factor, partial [Planctomycetes bacterium]|nr:sigma-70 family RNA polymerase sigma factor [Planctomycetota bacterium]